MHTSAPFKFQKTKTKKIFHPKQTNNMASPHVLSVQSSVTLGHVGNSAAVFPMQYRGVNVSALHTLQYSSHVAYNCGFAGTKIPEADIRAMFTKLRTLEAETPLFTHILSGYIG